MPSITFRRLLLVAFLLLAGTTVQATAPTDLADTPWPMFQRNAAHTGSSSFSGITGQPTVLWKRKLQGFGAPGYSEGMSVGANNTIYAAAFGDLYAFGYPEGSLKWHRPLGGYSRSVPAVASDGRMYWGFDDSFAVISSTGTILGGVTGMSLNLVFGGSPTIGPDGTVYVVHDALWAFTPDGAVKWFYAFGDFSHGPPSIGADGTIYIAGFGKFYAFRPDGSVKWQKALPVGDNGTSIGPDGTIYIGLDSSELHAYAPDGTLRWIFKSDVYSIVGIKGISGAPAIGSDGTIYFATALSIPEPIPAQVYAVNPDGTLKWKQPIALRPGSGRTGTVVPLVVDRDNRVYGCADNGACYGWDSDGALLWEYETGQGLWNRTTPLLMEDGVMWVLDGAGVLHALADPSLPALLATPSLVALTACDNESPSYTVHLNTKGPAIPWSVSVDPPASWLSLNKSSGTTPEDLVIQVNTTGLSAGSYQARLLITSTGNVVNETVEIPVGLEVGCKIYLPIILNEGEYEVGDPRT